MIIKLPKPVNGQTHVRITQVNNRGGENIEVIGEYGTSNQGGDFVPATQMLQYNPTIAGEFFEDLIAESEKRGRKAKKDRLSVDLEDIRDWTEEDGADERVEAKHRAKEDATARPVSA
jgi:hypothetical protein